MSEFFKNKRSAVLAISAFFLAVTLMAGSLAYLFEGVGTLVGQEAESSSQPVSQEPTEEDDEPAQGDAPLDDEPEPEPEQETEPASDPVEAEPIHYNRPDEMRGVYLVPGTDFITSGDTTTETVKAEIDKALTDAINLTMNTVIIDTVYADTVIYQTADSPELSPDFDILDYIVKKCREAGLYTYAIFDASFYEKSRPTASLLAINAGSINTLSVNLREFAEKYPVDGILLDGYTNTQTPQSYSIYAVVGAAIGYDNFMRQTPEATMRTVSRTLRKYARGMQVGLLADAVWENASANEEGSATTATFTALGSGHADTKSFLTEGLVDFVAVKAYASTTDTATPFGEVVKWWSGVAREAAVPMYAVHASDKVCTSEPGWQAQDQLVRQLIEANEVSGFGGSIFNNLKRLSEDPQSSTTTLIKYYNQEVEPTHILTELAVTKPEQTSFTTTEQVVTFTGASDPNFPVTINGEEITTDDNGYFTVTQGLSGGENTFTISHKDKSINYAIVREIEILKEITPQGSIAAEGNMSINITALAYEDAEVYATVGGTTIPMSLTEDEVVEEADRDSSYRTFSGQYTTPVAIGEEQNLGNVVVTAMWQGQEKSLEGAHIKVNKKAKIEDGVPVVVVADQAMTYPYNTLDNIPNSKYYPLPQGAMDYAVGDEIVYKKGSSTYTYFVLASKLRVEAADIATSADYASGNAINDMTIHSEGGYTYVTLKTAQKISYTFAYAADGVSVTFHNTTRVPGNATVDDNAIFNNAYWNDSTLSLSFIKDGGFMGYKGYYDGDDLVLRFNNPPNSVSGARIAIDPGHGGRDVGALGFLADYPEKVLNLAIARLLAEELTSRGADVLLLDTTGGMELKDRVQKAENWNADLFVSVHNNTAPNAKATGTEVYYFYPFAKTLAASAASQVSGQLSTDNRGAKQSYYHITLSSQMPSVLVECGFMTNQGEYEKLIKSKSQGRIATGIADAIAASIKAAATGYVEETPATPTDPSDEDPPEPTDPNDEDLPEPTDPHDDDPPEPTDPNDDEPPEPITPNDGSSSSGNGTDVEGVFLVASTLTLEVGDSFVLDYDIEPSTAVNRKVTWRSGNTSVATVNADGKVTALAEGKVKITITTEDGEFEATCIVTVVAAGSNTEPNNNESYGDNQYIDSEDPEDEPDPVAY
jgi:N-acetylmuramoyl-L-alanine amidase/uncharacterized lipoprotein YddW (UPF0748 family)